MPRAVTEAFVAASRQWVNLEQLQAAASSQIAEITATEAGLVTSGSAAALTLGAAAILTGHDLGRMERLPDTSDMPSEFLIAREQRSGYDHAVRAAGARLVEVGFNEIVSGAGVRRTELWEYEAAISTQTAGILYVVTNTSVPRLAEVVDLAQRNSLPVLVDAAGELPPRKNLTAFAKQGADLIAFSGGKAIRGPQSTGILCGKRQYISAAALQMLDMDDHYALWDPPEELIERTLIHGHPRHGIGRGFKVSKEEIVALLTALKLFASGEYDGDLPHQRRRLEIIEDRLAGHAMFTTRMIDDPTTERGPLLEIDVTTGESAKAAFEVCRRLRQATPPVYVGHGKLDHGTLVVNPLCLDDDGAIHIASQLIEIANQLARPA